MFEGASVVVVSADMEHCALFTFIAEFCLMGLICLWGIGGNTAAVAVLWHETSVTAPIFLLQAALIADIATCWILFIAEGIPALEYITHALDDCMIVCSYVTIITRPLLFLAQFCSAWFCIMALHGRALIMCKPGLTEQAMSLGRARKQAVCIVVIGLFLTLPLTFDTALEFNKNEALVHNYWYRSIYLYTVLFLAATLIPMLAAAYFCIRLAMVVRSVHNLRRVLVPSYRLENLDMTQVILGIGVTLVICYIPQLALCVSQWVDLKTIIQSHCATLHYYLTTFSNFFISINAAMKLIILCVLARRFKAKLRQQFCVGGKDCKAGVTGGSGGVYQCLDRSEMTLISHMEHTPETPVPVEDNPVIRLLSASASCRDYNEEYSCKEYNEEY